MKIKILFIAFLSLTTNLLAQITVNDIDLVDQGDVLYNAYDSNPSSAINIGASGLNQNWNFSSLQATEVDTLYFISPIGTLNAGLYSNVNLCMDDNGSISYLNKNISGLFIHGISDTVFSTPAVFLPLPLSYGLSTTDGPIVVIEEEITGAFLSAALPPAIISSLTNGLANQADTALIQVTNTTEFTVDASGSMTTPLGVFDVLRLKQVKSISSVLNVYVSDTVTQFGSWLTNIPFSSIPLLANFSNNEKEIIYQWITNDANVEFLVAEVDVDSLDNIISGVSFQTNSSISSINELDLDNFNIYPIPSNGSFTIEHNSNEYVDFELLDNTGKLILEDRFCQSSVISLSKLPRGLYFLNLTVGNTTTTKRIIN